MLRTGANGSDSLNLMVRLVAVCWVAQIEVDVEISVKVIVSVMLLVQPPTRLAKLQLGFGVTVSTCIYYTRLLHEPRIRRHDGLS